MSAGLEIEVASPEAGGPPELGRRLDRAARAVLSAAGVTEGHLAIALVDEGRIRELNATHRGVDHATDVLSFPVDGAALTPGPRELGDVVICPDHATDLTEAVVHGVLHLCGHDHEQDDGEMLSLQRRVVGELAGTDAESPGGPPAGGGARPPPRGGWAAADRTRRLGQVGESEPAATRAGFVALAGRPNVGKSTLLNRIVGTKVAIVSPRPQTTRRAIRGVATAEDWQLVLVDLPGSQRPRDALTERMQRRTERELRDCDAVLLMLNGEQPVGPGDRFLATAVTAAKVPCVVAVNKADALDHPRTVRALAAAAELELPADAEIFPISARTGAGIEPLLEALVARLPEGPFPYPPAEATDLPTEVRVAELVREQALLRTREELPHAVEVEVEEIDQRPGGPLVVRAHLWAEGESQKRILVGRGGRMVRGIGAAARGEIESLSGRHVHLDLTVRVRRGWRRDEAMLDRLGID